MVIPILLALDALILTTSRKKLVVYLVFISLNGLSASLIQCLSLISAAERNGECFYALTRDTLWMTNHNSFTPSSPGCTVAVAPRFL